MLCYYRRLPAIPRPTQGKGGEAKGGREPESLGAPPPGHRIWGKRPLS